MAETCEQIRASTGLYRASVGDCGRFERSIARHSADGQSVGIVLTARTAGKVVHGANDALEGVKPASASSGKSSN
jgi:hypothetical protein